MTGLDDVGLRSAFERGGQGHVFAAWKHLPAAERARLAATAARIDLDLVRTLHDLARAPRGHAAPKRFEPPELVALHDVVRGSDRIREARARGAAMLAAGGVGFLMVAGGQASRLGFEGPKGTFPAGPVTGRSLFEILARRLVAVRERHGAQPCWYIMTSPANDAATRAFFARHGWFGLREEDVFFFAQAMLPALDEKGRILMADAASPFLAPNGHGGVLSGLLESGALEHARSRGVDVLSYFQVDNPLALPADPLFLGLHALAGATMSSKVVRKRDASEKVGVLGKVDGRQACIEYSDLPADLREARDAHGELVYGAGNIALHVFDLAFVEELTRGGLRLPWHVARKEVRALDDAGKTTSLPAVKFETFVFDALAFAERSVTLEVDRSREFSPIKNAEGDDSPATARAAQCRLYAGWAAQKGCTLPPADARGDHPVEVDPVLAEDLETFLERAACAPEVRDKGHFYA